VHAPSLSRKALDRVDERDSYEEFLRTVEPRLRYALVAGHGAERGLDALSDALVYGMRHWDRVRRMKNPAGYLYRVGQRLARRRPRTTPMPLPEIPRTDAPWIEPHLSAALATLSKRQREVVVLVEAFEYTHQEASEILGIARSSIQTHLERGLVRLRAALGVDDE
jgi:DNA-directed RNA polymerase specialized sigma24 family protein